jgi:hypothetical protein
MPAAIVAATVAAGENPESRKDRGEERSGCGQYHDRQEPCAYRWSQLRGCLEAIGRLNRSPFLLPLLDRGSGLGCLP